MQKEGFLPYGCPEALCHKASRRDVLSASINLAGSRLPGFVVLSEVLESSHISHLLLSGDHLASGMLDHEPVCPNAEAGRL